jgi:hypothetical protein
LARKTFKTQKMKLKTKKYSIITDTADTFWIVKTVYILGISWSYELIGERSSLFSSFDIPFYSLFCAEKRLKELTTNIEIVLL